jgi:4-carboxymuconolactone decarboxylase
MAQPARDPRRAVTMLAITTCGFPTAIAGLRWVEDVLAREAAGE